mmetsp:Transcript_38512/g.78556  ORF Transcript_38512/g.78556 Transcript_38512/m.78556 type:complete len:224 (+) Transcript_38512:545-1216(+)
MRQHLVGEAEHSVKRHQDRQQDDLNGARVPPLPRGVEEEIHELRSVPRTPSARHDPRKQHVRDPHDRSHGDVRNLDGYTAQEARLGEDEGDVGVVDHEGVFGSEHARRLRSAHSKRVGPEGVFDDRGYEEGGGGRNFVGEEGQAERQGSDEVLRRVPRRREGDDAREEEMETQDEPRPVGEGGVSPNAPKGDLSGGGGAQLGSGVIFGDDDLIAVGVADPHGR